MSWGLGRQGWLSPALEVGSGAWLFSKPGLDAENTANTRPLKGRLRDRGNDWASAGQPSGKRQLRTWLWFGQQEGNACLGPGVGGTAGPGMEAQQALWPRWGSGCRLGSSLEKQGRIF